MTMTTTVDAILDEITQLSIEDQEMVDEIVHKRIIEGKREEIRSDYWSSRFEKSLRYGLDTSARSWTGLNRGDDGSHALSLC